MQILDCTLRDGANVVGNGFNEELTKSIIAGLIRNGIRDIEFGNAKGLGACEKLKAPAPLTDEEYMDVAQPWVGKGQIGMFMQAKCLDKNLVSKAAEKHLHFLRVGANAGDGKSALEAVREVKKAGLYCRYSLMKAYLLTPDELAAEAVELEAAGVDIITIMDSAGTMFPEDVKAYVSALKAKLSIPVGFHGHSNLGLSQANALAAAEAGADEIDGGLLGMARSAGNCATELAVATLQKKGYLPEIDLQGLLDYLDEELIPLMAPWGYKPAVDPTELILGLTGTHSSGMKLFEQVAAEEQVPLRKLITAVAKKDRRSPGEELIRETARSLAS